MRGRYDKAHLVPYGEYLPMRPLLSAIGLSPARARRPRFPRRARARARSICPASAAPGVQICYEIIFSGQVVDRAEPARLHLQPLQRRLVRRLGPAPASRPGAAARDRGGAAGDPRDADRHLGGDRRRRAAARRACRSARPARSTRACRRARRRPCSPASATCCPSPSPCCSSRRRLQSGAKRASGRRT